MSQRILREFAMRKLFIISDLHLGGRPDVYGANGRISQTGFQICHAHAELVEFIRWVMTHGKGLAVPRDLELIVNGDFVDFLAEDDPGEPSLPAQVWTNDEEQAIRKLQRIVERTRVGSGDGVFMALGDFLAAGHRLTLMLGNHDVELALPAVRQHLIDLLGGDHVLLKFLYDGEAYTVGTVLVEHGNRYDHWNIINHSALRQERSMRSRKLPVREEHRKDRYFIVPAGTYLVIHFMNRIKSRYRFIDLLKPETNAVVPLLVALEPGYRPHLDDLLKAAPVALKPVKQKLRPGYVEPTLPRRPGEMGAPSAAPVAVGGDLGNRAVLRPAPGGAPAYQAESQAEQTNLYEHLVADSNVSLDKVLLETLGSDIRYFAATEGSAGEDLSIRDKVGGVIDWVRGRFEQFAETADSASRYFQLLGARTDEQRLQQLHAALRQLNCKDTSFSLSEELPEYLEAAKETAETGNFEVITYGHTHLPKAQALGSDRDKLPRYFNTGTWCDVMRLPPDITREYALAKDELKKFVAALQSNDFARYIQRYLTFLEIDLHGETGKERVQQAELYCYGGPGHERSAPYTSIVNAQAGGAA